MSNAVATSFSVPESNVAGLKVAIEKLNKRAKRLHVAPITIEVPGTFKDVELTHNGKKTGVVVRKMDVTIVGQSPRFEGFTFVATLEHVDGEVMLRTAPSFEGEMPARFRTASPHTCEHCHTVRNRNETFVVLGPDGNYTQVGRQCLKDFLGFNANPASLAAMAEILWEAVALGGDAEGEGGGRTDNRLDLLNFLGFAAAGIRVAGWMSAGRARDLEMQSTKDLALNVLFAKGKAASDFKAAGLYPTDEDREMAAKALEWARTKFGGMDADARDDFSHNLFVVTKGDAITFKMTGIAAYVVAGYQKDQAILKERQILSAGVKDGVHMGVEGEKLEFQGVLYKVHGLNTEFGVSYMHFFRSVEGNKIVWFTSSRPTDEAGVEIEPSDKVLTVSGRVKRHEVREDIRQTVMTRCTVWTDTAVALRAEKEARKTQRAAKKAAKVKVDFLKLP